MFEARLFRLPGWSWTACEEKKTPAPPDVSFRRSSITSGYMYLLPEGKMKTFVYLPKTGSKRLG